MSYLKCAGCGKFIEAPIKPEGSQKIISKEIYSLFELDEVLWYHEKCYEILQQRTTNVQLLT